MVVEYRGFLFPWGRWGVGERIEWMGGEERFLLEEGGM